MPKDIKSGDKVRILPSQVAMAEKYKGQTLLVRVTFTNGACILQDKDGWTFLFRKEWVEL